MRLPELKLLNCFMRKALKDDHEQRSDDCDDSFLKYRFVHIKERILQQLDPFYIKTVFAGQLQTELQPTIIFITT